jgi:chromosomal replication initiation ATPase DnaA
MALALHEQANHYAAVRARLWPSRCQFIVVPKRTWSTPTVIALSTADRLSSIVADIAARRYVTTREIINIVALAFDVPAAAILGRSRRYAEPRQIAMALAFRQMRGVSYRLAKVTRAFRRDHSTVLHAVRKYEAVIESAEARAAPIAE